MAVRGARLRGLEGRPESRTELRNETQASPGAGAKTGSMPVETPQRSDATRIGSAAKGDFPVGTLVPTLVLVGCALGLLGNIPRRHRCPAGSRMIAGEFCIDPFEASLVEVLPRGRTRPWSPYTSPVEGRRYRAVSRRGVVPQGYVSQVQARAACAAAGKRLCREAEWVQACRGPAQTPWPYGPTYQRGRCNDGRPGPVPRLFGGGNVFHAAQMNDPRVNQLSGTVAPTGRHRRCTNRYGVFDMVGNLHEWVESTTRNGRGVFRGGYYVDVHINGEGCGYATRAHSPTYHDYSIGFRCCATLR